MTDEELFADVAKRLRMEAEHALAFLSFASIANQLDIVEFVNRLPLVPSAKLVRVGIIQSVALCACRMCDRGKDTYSIFRARKLLERDDIRRLVVKDMVEYFQFESFVQVIEVDPDTHRLKHFRDNALVHMISGKYAAGVGADYESLFRISKLAIDAVFALTAATGSVVVGVPAVYDTWHDRNQAYWNHLLGLADVEPQSNGLSGARQHGQ